jgi:hydrogenase/urease accessory protein HupE
VGISKADYAWENGRLLVAIAFARAELADQLVWLVDRDGKKSLVAFEDQRQHLGAWLAAGLAIAADGEPCTPSFDAMRFDGDGIVFALAYTCSPTATAITIDARFLSDLGSSHRQLATFRVEPRVDEFVATAERPSISFALRAAPTARESRLFPLVRMGVEHILTGYDHLLFLLGLVLVGGPLRSLAAAVTAFTVSHSITLALAAFDVWTPNPSLVEPCIALSIAYVGIENLFVDSAVGRYKITFPFGLVHGFGFASALRAAAIPRTDVPLALFGFNVGVEVGQLAAIAVLLPLVLAVRRNTAWRRPAMRACTAAVALAGAAWFVFRVKSAIG